VPNSAAGSHTVTATDNAGHSASARFTVTPSLSATLVQNIYGSYFAKVSGKGFDASSTISVYLDGALKKTITSNQYGSFGATFYVKSGSHTILVRDASGNTLSAGISVP
jgi:hypothetical protein